MKPLSFKNLLLLLLLLMDSVIYSIPMYNQYDPFAYHTIKGIDHTYKRKQKNRNQVRFDLSPFYQYACGARNKDGLKVPEGDMFGRWNMFGLFYGYNAAPTTKSFVTNVNDTWKIPDANTITNYPKLSDSWRVLDKLNEGSGRTTPPLYDTVNLENNYTDPVYYNLDSFNKYFPKIYTNYEKFGLRGQINLSLKKGFGFNIKGGLVDYKQTPEFEKDDSFSPTYQNDDNDGNIYTYLVKPDVLQAITAEVGLNSEAYQQIALEDTHIEFSYQIPFDVMNNDNEHVVTMIPYIAAGLWIPTGKEKNQNAAFSLPTGNNGFWGMTLDGQINFELSQSMLWGFGMGTSYFFDRSLDDYRIASHEYQQGIFPWSANINKDPGLLWYFNSTLKAEQFIDNFSAYVDFIYLRHNKDVITLRESNPSRNEYFKPTINEDNSKWWATMFQGGIEYIFSEGLQMGLGFQAHLSGRRVYRGITLLGTMSFVF